MADIHQILLVDPSQIEGSTIKIPESPTVSVVYLRRLRWGFYPAIQKFDLVMEAVEHDRPDDPDESPS